MTSSGSSISLVWFVAMGRAQRNPSILRGSRGVDGVSLRSYPCRTATSTEIFRHRRLVPFQPEPRPSRGDRAIDDLGGVGEDHAGEIEEFEPVRGRRHRQHVGAGLGEQMARHRNVGGFRLGRDLQPAGDAAALHQVGHDEVAGAGFDRFGKAAREPPVLAGLDRRRRGLAHFCVSGQIFLRHRLLDPVQIVGCEAGDAARGFSGIERLVEVDHQRDIRTEQGAHALDHPLVVGGIAVAALDLDAAKTLFERAAQRLFVGGGIDHAIAVIGPDRFWRAAEQLGHRLVRRSGRARPNRPCRGLIPPCRRGPASRAAGIWRPSPPSGRRARPACRSSSRPISSIRCTSGFSVSLV